MKKMVSIMVLFLIICSAFSVVAISHRHHSPCNAGFKVDVIKERVGVNE